MGVLPLELPPGESATSLGITGRESFTIRGLEGGIEPKQTVTVVVRDAEGDEKTFEAKVRIDGPAEVEYFRHGGILKMVLRQMLAD